MDHDQQRMDVHKKGGTKAKGNGNVLPLPQELRKVLPLPQELPEQRKETHTEELPQELPEQRTETHTEESCPTTTVARRTPRSCPRSSATSRIPHDMIGGGISSMSRNHPSHCMIGGGGSSSKSYTGCTV